MIRTVINIDESKCDGCGICIDSCMEGALQLIDGKAKLISELYCDGLGACLKDCPQGAIKLEQREAKPYDEKLVMQRIAGLGKRSIIAHLKHLIEHNERAFFNDAVEYLKENNIDIDIDNINFNIPAEQNACSSGGCPGSKEMSFINNETADTIDIPSALRQWPVQLHLLNPEASYFRNSDVLLAADCAAYTVGNFHGKYLNGKTLAIACPKLDSNQESYAEKLKSMIDNGGIRSLTVLIMEVPCCGGLFKLANFAVSNAARKIPLKVIVIGIQGDVKMEKEFEFAVN